MANDKPAVFSRRAVLGAVVSSGAILMTGNLNLVSTAAATASGEHLSGAGLVWGGGLQHAVSGSGGVGLHVREWGNPIGQPILFVHAWSQSLMSWVRQYNSDLTRDFRLIAFDLRGHGQSEKPMQDRAYTDGQAWAEDIAAIIAGLRLTKPVLVASSYAGFIVCDYLERFGQENVGAINFVGAAVLNTRPEYFGAAFGELLPGLTSPDLATNIEATRRFVRVYHHAQLEDDVSETILAFNMATPPEVRQWCVSRQLDFTDVLKKIRKPTLVTQGNSDALVQQAMFEHVLNSVHGATGSRYESVSHAPPFENGPRFNKELAELARNV